MCCGLRPIIYWVPAFAGTTAALVLRASPVCYWVPAFAGTTAEASLRSMLSLAHSRTVVIPPTVMPALAVTKDFAGTTAALVLRASPVCYWVPAFAGTTVAAPLRPMLSLTLAHSLFPTLLSFPPLYVIPAPICHSREGGNPVNIRSGAHIFCSLILAPV